MPQKLRRVTIEIPDSLYRRLEEQAAIEGNSVSTLVCSTVTNEFGPAVQRRRVKFPLIVSKGPKVSLSNELIYTLIPLP